MRTPEAIFPEYYIIRVNEFNRVAKTPLEEWISYLKDGEIRPNTTTPGLAEAREKLQYLKMSKQERQDYDRHMDAIMTQNDVLDTAKMEGLAEGRAEGLVKGRAEGLAEGRAEGIKATALKLKEMRMTLEHISIATGLTQADIEQL